MKRLSMTMSIGLFVAAMAAPSFAADLPRPSYKAPVYAPSYYNWTGFYAGINAGYGFGKSDWSGAGGTGSTKPKGFIGGVQLGYNLQTGIWVWGLEADFQYSGMKGSDSSGTGVCTGAGCETKLTWFGTGRGRIGYAGWDRWLPYITGGAATATSRRRRRPAATGPRASSAGPWAPASNTPCSPTGPPSSNISTPTSAPSRAARRATT
jgi:outer membrane immunogenic protein